MRPLSNERPNQPAALLDQKSVLMENIKMGTLGTWSNLKFDPKTKQNLPRKWEKNVFMAVFHNTALYDHDNNINFVIRSLFIFWISTGCGNKNDNKMVLFKKHLN